MIGRSAIFGDMSQSDQQVSAYRFRIVLRRTSPHIGRRVVVRSDFTLGQLHQTVQPLFGWTDSRPHRFVLRGRSLGACATAAASSWPAPEALLSEFKLLAKGSRSGKAMVDVFSQSGIGYLAMCVA